MPAMTMAFETSADAPSVREGDRITATLVVTETGSHLESVRITGREGAVDAQTPSPGRALPGPRCPTCRWSTRTAGRSPCATSRGGSWSSRSSTLDVRCPISARSWSRTLKPSAAVRTRRGSRTVWHCSASRSTPDSTRRRAPVVRGISAGGQGSVPTVDAGHRPRRAH